MGARVQMIAKVEQRADPTGLTHQAESPTVPRYCLHPDSVVHRQNACQHKNDPAIFHIGIQFSDGTIGTQEIAEPGNFIPRSPAIQTAKEQTGTAIPGKGCSSIARVKYERSNTDIGRKIRCRIAPGDATVDGAKNASRLW